MQDLMGLLDTKTVSRIRLNELMSKHTTLGIGGPADIYYEANDIDDFIYFIKACIKSQTPYVVIGDGSNILVKDNGIRGVVIRLIDNSIKIGGVKKAPKNMNNVDKIIARWDSDKTKGTFKFEFKDLDYDESDSQRIEVEASAGVKLQYLIRYCLDNGVTGLQWYAYIPGTIGGAVYNNVHGGTHFISEVLQSVQVLDANGDIKTLNISDIKAGYDSTTFHNSMNIILKAKLLLFKGDVEKAKAVVKEWTLRKSPVQPMNSAGCVFRNISDEDKLRMGYPTTSIGYIVEHILGMKGYTHGRAAVSEKHSNFIVNNGGATSEDYLYILNKIRDEFKEKTGIELIPEIIILGE